MRKSKERHHIVEKSQNTLMTFDWENKADPLQNGFGALKILNEEIITPGPGFVLHTPEDILIVTHIHEGVVVYKNPAGKPDLPNAGEFYQINTFPGGKPPLNNENLGETHIFKIGFNPELGDPEPIVIKKLFTRAERAGIFKLIASSQEKEDPLKVRRNVQIYSTFICKGNHIIHELKPGRRVWLHVVKGEITSNQLHLFTGDGAGISDEISVSFTAQEESEILLFDLA